MFTLKPQLSIKGIPDTHQDHVSGARHGHAVAAHNARVCPQWHAAQDATYVPLVRTRLRNLAGTLPLQREIQRADGEKSASEHAIW